MKRTLSAIVVTAALTAALPAQRELDARSFLPADYNGEVRFDMKAIVDSGLWDPIERSMFRMLLGTFYDEMGFDLADVDSIRYAIRTTSDEDGGRERVGAWIFEGSERVDLARMPQEQREGFTVESRDGVEWLHDEWDNEIVSPRPGLLVIGTGGAIGPVMRGQQRGGVPLPDLLALTAAPGTLALVANVLPPPHQQERFDLAPIPFEWFVGEDRPAAIRLRLASVRATGEVQLEMLLRFHNGEAGPAHFDSELNSWVDSLAEAEAPLRGVAALLEGLATRIDRRDFYATIGLGQPAQAGARLATMAALMVPAVLVVREEVVAAPAQVQIQVLEVREEVEDPPEEEPPPPVRKKR